MFLWLIRTPHDLQTLAQTSQAYPAGLGKCLLSRWRLALNESLKVLLQRVHWRGPPASALTRYKAASSCSLSSVSTSPSTLHWHYHLLLQFLWLIDMWFRKDCMDLNDLLHNWQGWPPSTGKWTPSKWFLPAKLSLNDFPHKVHWTLPPSTLFKCFKARSFSSVTQYLFHSMISGVMTFKSMFGLALVLTQLTLVETQELSVLGLIMVLGFVKSWRDFATNKTSKFTRPISQDTFDTSFLKI